MLTGAILNKPESLTTKYVQKLKNAAEPYNTVFAVSPETDGIEELLPVMMEGGAPAFIIHTRANVEQTQKAISLGVGAVHATHFYDVFPYPGVRECGNTS